MQKEADVSAKLQRDRGTVDVQRFGSRTQQMQKEADVSAKGKCESRPLNALALAGIAEAV
jgi:hypothetical protein